MFSFQLRTSFFCLEGINDGHGVGVSPSWVRLRIRRSATRRPKQPLITDIETHNHRLSSVLHQSRVVRFLGDRLTNFWVPHFSRPAVAAGKIHDFGVWLSVYDQRIRREILWNSAKFHESCTSINACHPVGVSSTHFHIRSLQFRRSWWFVTRLKPRIF